MTEEEWLATNAGWMLDHIEKHASPSPRKMRLLAVAYARFLETQPEYADCKPVAHLGEEVAEGLRTLDELWHDRVRGWGFAGTWAIANLVLAPDRLGNKIRLHLVGVMRDLNADQATSELHMHRHCAVLRPLILCVLGNPFRPVVVEPAWRTSDVLLLAQGIYEESAFNRMPILADALQDAGCTNDDVLDHCRDTNTPHARGCWVVDALLNKV
jgi:hypothetical protein